MPTATGLVGVYPGSFNPPTLAHLAIADAAVQAHGLSRLDLVISRRALDKEHVERPRLEDRLSVLEDLARAREWLGVGLTDHQLLVDIATGYDVLVLGADKYQQLLDPRYYGGAAARDTSLARLPTLAVAPRPPHEAPRHTLLSLDGRHHETSSTAARRDAPHLMVPEARAFDRRTGAWSDPERYERWLTDS